MLLIVCHHYVVNSGLFPLIQSNPDSPQSVFLSLFGMWGKTGINCFVLISGYFMCQSKITLKKFLKLFLQIEFYNVLVYFVFLLFGITSFSIKALAIAIMPIRNVNSGFISAYLLYYLFIPFLNKLVNSLTQKEHGILIGLCLLLFSIGARLNFGFYIASNYLIWFSILHFIASYLRFYGLCKDDNPRFWGTITICLVFLSCLSVWISLHNGLNPYRFVQDSNAPLALLTATSSFMFFKSITLPNSQLINQIAAGTFGVLLIHANSDAMRAWLWGDTLKNVSHFDSPYLHAIISVILVFCICDLIDYLRRSRLERPTMSFIEQKVLSKLSSWKSK